MANGFASPQNSVNPRPTHPPLPLSLDAETIQGQWQAHFADLDAPRGRQGVEPPFLSLVLLGQVKVATKSHEIMAIPALLKLLDIRGCIITLDAMGTQTAIAREIIGHGADYVLCLKANHPTLWAEVTPWFEQAEAAHFEGLEHRYDARVESGHHRREHRQVWAVPVAVMGELHPIEPWAGLNTIVLVRRVRHPWNKTTREQQFLHTPRPLQVRRQQRRGELDATAAAVAHLRHLNLHLPNACRHRALGQVAVAHHHLPSLLIPSVLILRQEVFQLRFHRLGDDLAGSPANQIAQRIAEVLRCLG